MANKMNNEVAAKANQAAKSNIDIDTLLNSIRENYVHFYNFVRRECSDPNTLSDRSKYYFFATDIILQKNKEDLGNYLAKTVKTYCYKNQQAYFELIIALYVTRSLFMDWGLTNNAELIEQCLYLSLEEDDYYTVEYADFTEFAVFMRELDEIWKELKK